VIETTINKIHTEGAYFMNFAGKRTAFFFFDLKGVFEIPQIGEPFFMQLNASVEFLPVMNGEELQEGLTAAMSKSARMN
jgi:hypothetical protein